MDCGALHRETVRIDHLETDLDFRKITLAAMPAFWLLYDTDCTIHFSRSNVVDKIAIPECERLARVYTLEGIDRDDEPLTPPNEEVGPLRVKIRSDYDGSARAECVDGALLMTDVYISKVRKERRFPPARCKIIANAIEFRRDAGFTGLLAQEMYERLFRPTRDMLHLVELDLADARDIDEDLPSPWDAVAEERDAEDSQFELDEHDLATLTSAVANIGEVGDAGPDDSKAPATSTPIEVLTGDGDTDDIVQKPRGRGRSRLRPSSTSKTAIERVRKQRRINPNPDGPALTCVAYLKKRHGIVIHDAAESPSEKTGSGKSKYMASQWLEEGGHLDLVICRSCSRGQACNLKAVNYAIHNSTATVDRDNTERSELIMAVHDKYYSDPRQGEGSKAWTPRQDPYRVMYAQLRTVS
ncbi:hypothetical protein CYMTET_2924 [Cymbomonas tetramitiformis]|uniref:Uncharacterized protein n=1 Tax=Cymbomonas tetramitiformis TaxID=36881 RepID=A0AAE0LM25_9CHLO|nr:hypothetical protein CYMTET_2924 [Cymbomonas tetramitiformis]